MNDQAELVVRANRDLSEALAALYAAFAGYPPPEDLEASPLRDAEAILAHLRSAPLKQLSAASLGRYASCALTNVGDVAEYKHFLPRIVHLAVVGGEGEPGLDACCIASKLNYGVWLGWPDRERFAIVRAFSAAWARLRFFHPDERDAEEWLCASAILGLDVVPKLAAWLKDTSVESMLQLADFIIGTGALYVPDGYWESVPPEIRSEIVGWLRGDDVLKGLRDMETKVPEGDRWRFDLARHAIVSHRAE